jgi:DNA polymerase elongation subunit (family B)
MPQQRKQVKRRVYVYDWQERDETFEDGKTSLVIKVFGISDDGKDVCISIENYKPKIDVEICDAKGESFKIFDKGGCEISRYISTIDRDIRGKCRERKIFCDEGVYMEKIKLSGDKYAQSNEEKDAKEEKNKGERKYFDVKYPILQYSLSSKEDMEKFYHLFDGKFASAGGKRFRLTSYGVDRNIDQVLRMTAYKDLPLAGWVDVAGLNIEAKDEARDCRLDEQIICSWDKIEKCANYDAVPNFKILSFDIEAHHASKISMPNPNLPSDEIFMISYTFLDRDKKVSKYLYYSGSGIDEKKGSLWVDQKELDKMTPDCKIKVVRVQTEADLILSIKTMIHNLKPNILTGYNIIGWDMNYIIDRSKQSYINVHSSLLKTSYLEGSKWMSGEYRSLTGNKGNGKQDLKYFKMPGLLLLDMMFIIKRDGVKLVNYKLATVTQHYNVPTKREMPMEKMTKLYKERKYTTLADYCMQDSYIVLLLMRKLNSVVGLCEKAKTCCVPIFYIYTQGNQIQIYSQVLRCAIEDNMVINQSLYEYKKFIGATVLDPKPGRYSKVLSLDFSGLYPSIIMAYNIDYSTIVSVDSGPKKNMYKTPYIPEEDIYSFHFDEHRGCDHDDNRKKKKNGDYKKIDPKTIICNLSRKYNFLRPEVYKVGAIPKRIKFLVDKRKETRNQLKQLRLDVIKDMSEFGARALLMTDSKEEISFLEEKWKNEDRDIYEEVWPKLKKLTREELLKIPPLVGGPPSGRSLKELAEIINNNIILISVLDSRQLSFKINANSMYGAFGVQAGLLPFNPGASTVTYVGRKAIASVMYNVPIIVKQKYGYGVEIIYGDTDSCMAKIIRDEAKEGPFSVKEIIDIANHILSVVNTLPDKNGVQIIRKPMNLSFDHYYEYFIILSPKRYIAEVANTSGVIIEKVNKGVVLARRDNCMLLKEIYSEIGQKIKYSIRGDVGESLIDLEKKSKEYISRRELLVKHYKETCKKLKAQRKIDKKARHEKKEKLYIKKVQELAQQERNRLESRKHKVCAKKLVYRTLEEIHSIKKEEKKINENTMNINIQNYIADFMNKMYQREFSAKYYTVTKSITRQIEEYKDITQKSSCHIMLAKQMMARGVDVPVSSKIEYLFTTKCRGQKHFLQFEKAIDYDYYKLNRTKYQIDYTFYILRQLMKPLDQLIGISLGLKDEVKTQLKYRLEKEEYIRHLNMLTSPTYRLLHSKT